MAQTAKKPILLPVRGLDVSAPAEFIDPSGASAIQNIEINRNIIRKRTGTTALGSSLGEGSWPTTNCGKATATTCFDLGQPR